MWMQVSRLTMKLISGKYKAFRKINRQASNKLRRSKRHLTVKLDPSDVKK